MRRFLRAFGVIWTLMVCLAMRFVPAFRALDGTLAGVILLIPMIGAVLGATRMPRHGRWSRDIQRGLHWAGLLMLMIFAVAASASFGLLFLPGALAIFLVDP